MPGGFRLAVLAALTVALPACGQDGRELAANATSAPAAETTTSSSETVALRLVVAPEGNAARYRVREQLAGIDFPNDAVGETTAVTGSIAFDEAGNVMPAESRIEVNLTGLKSDKERRDGYLQRNTLATAEHPTVVLVPTEVRGLAFPLPRSGERAFELVGDLTVKGVTRSTTWRGRATFAPGQVTGHVTTTFAFADFALEKPRVRSVFSVEDTIGLEYDFRLIAE